MIAYNKDWLDAIRIREKAENWFKNGLLSEEKAKDVFQKYPSGFYSPNWFIRIGLFFFGQLILTSLIGLVALFVGLDKAWEFFSIFIGIAIFTALELLIIREKRHFRSGLDDVFLYSALFSFLTGTTALVFENAPPEVLGIFWGLVLMLAAIRYMDILCSLAAFACFVGAIFYFSERVFGPATANFMPSIGIACAAGGYLFSTKLQKLERFRFWETPLSFVEAAALLFFYASSNVFVIEFYNKEILRSDFAPLRPLFWVMTFAIPAIYVWLGLKRRDRLMLDLGIFCVALAFATFRYYFHVIPLAWATAIGGAVLVATAWFSIRYLKTNHQNFTFSEDGRRSEFQRFQSFFIEEKFGHNNQGEGGQKGGGGGSF